MEKVKVYTECNTIITSGGIIYLHEKQDRIVCAMRFNNDQGFLTPVVVYDFTLNDLKDEKKVKEFMIAFNKKMLKIIRESTEHLFGTQDFTTEFSTEIKDVESKFSESMIEFIKKY